MVVMNPTLHLPVPLQTRVKLSPTILGSTVSGTVAGYSSKHVIFVYIVILDEPHRHDNEVHTAVVVPGTELMNMEGQYEWRLT